MFVIWSTNFHFVFRNGFAINSRSIHFIWWYKNIYFCNMIDFCIILFMDKSIFHSSYLLTFFLYFLYKFQYLFTDKNNFFFSILFMGFFILHLYPFVMIIFHIMSSRPHTLPNTWNYLINKTDKHIFLYFFLFHNFY